MLRKATTALILISTALSAAATQAFSNTGTLSGWSAQNHEHFGSVLEVTNVVYQGPTALKVTQIYDPSYTGRYHSEVIKTGAAQRGQERFYGFAFRLQGDWQFSPAQGYNIAQFIADFSDYGCDDWIPSTMIWLQGNQLYSRVKTGPVCSASITTFPNLATVSAGVWHRIVIQVNWQSNGSGYYKMWFDGAKIFERYNIPTLMDDGRSYQFSVGLYANGWHDDGGMKGTQGTRQIWYDEIAYGSTFADADPDQW